MKEIYPEKPEIRNVLSKCSNFDENDSHKKAEIELKFSYNETEKEKAEEDDKKEFKPKSLEEQETQLVNKLKKLFTNEYISEDFLKLSKKEQINWFCDFLKSEEDGFDNNFKILPNHLINLFYAITLDGDCGHSPENKPDWLDLEKFKRGQKFAMDNFFGLSYAQLLSLFILFTFEEGLKPLIVTGKSSTPYTAFKRYVSTGIRVRRWYTEDPWTKGTGAYKDIIEVRKMHAAVRKKLLETENDEINAASKIKNPYCPTRDILLEDFQSSCPEPALGQCPYRLNKSPEMKALIPKGLNQADMVATQFGFLGLMILYPKYFGAHNATEEDLEAFCHTWRGIGYLLGIDDNFNLCRGSLEEVKEQCKDFLELWAIPNLREFSPECEHMMRCVVESLQYYLPGSSYEGSVLYLSEMLNLKTPRLYSTLTYRTWMRHILLKTTFFYTCQVPGFKSFLNKRVNLSLDKAVNFSAERLEELKKRSEETLKKAVTTP